MVTGARFRRKYTRLGGLEALKRRSKGVAVKVGILQGTGIHPDSDNLTFAEIFAINEFGTDDGRVPARPVLQVVFVENRRKYKMLIKKLSKQVLKGQLPLDTARAILGETAQADVQRYMVDLKDPPNAPSTLAKKAPKTNPWINSGLTRQNVRWDESDVRLLRLRVSTGNPLASLLF